MFQKPSIVWFRQDLRIKDHPALTAAIQKGNPVIPIYVWSPEEKNEWLMGGASRWWLHHSLLALQEDLRTLGLPLLLFKGNSHAILCQLIEQTSAEAVFWNRRYQPSHIQQDAFIKGDLQSKGVKTQSFNGSLLFEPWMIYNKQKKPFQVFTPFWKHCLTLPIASPLPKPPIATSFKGVIKDIFSVEDLELLPKVKWDAGLAQAWSPGSQAAQKNLNAFLQKDIYAYHHHRDRADLPGTSRLSPYLYHGELSPRQVWQAVSQQCDDSQEGVVSYLRQLGWREFGYHLLYHFPQTVDEPLKESFKAFPWKYNQQFLKAWQKGMTGYPFVDAGMRQLWKSGWMHNRVRMVAASFLVKDLLIHWREGAKWFWDTLVDADLANNTMGWQWVAGSGADAAPYFRIFNPVTQGEKFDPDGHYIKTWIPELAALPSQWIHRPWEAPESALRQAGVVLGNTYPRPIVDHDEARKSALEAYQALR